MSREVVQIVNKLQALVNKHDHPKLGDYQYIVVDRPPPPNSDNTLGLDHHGDHYNERSNLLSATLLTALLLAQIEQSKNAESPLALHPEQAANRPDDLDEAFARMLICMWHTDGCIKALQWMADNSRLMSLLNLSEFFLLDPRFINLTPEIPPFPYRLSVYTSPRDVMYLWIDIGTSQIPKLQDNSLLDFRWQKQLLWIIENDVKNCPNSLITLVRTGMTQAGRSSRNDKKRSASSILTAGIWGKSDVWTADSSLQRTLDEFVLLTKALRLQLLANPSLNVAIHPRSRNQLTLTQPARFLEAKSTIHADIGTLINKALESLGCTLSR